MIDSDYEEWSYRMNPPKAPVFRLTIFDILECPTCRGKPVDVAKDFHLTEKGTTSISWRCAEGHRVMCDLTVDDGGTYVSRGAVIP